DERDLLLLDGVPLLHVIGQLHARGPHLLQALLDGLFLGHLIVSLTRKAGGAVSRRSHRTDWRSLRRNPARAWRVRQVRRPGAPAPTAGAPGGAWRPRGRRGSPRPGSPAWWRRGGRPLRAPIRKQSRRSPASVAATARRHEGR